MRSELGRSLWVGLEMPHWVPFYCISRKIFFEYNIGCIWKPSHFFEISIFIAFLAIIFLDSRDFYEILEKFFFFVKMKKFYCKFN